MMASRRTFLLFLSSWLTSPVASYARKRENYIDRSKVQTWIQETSARTGLSKGHIEKILVKARFSPPSARLMQSPQRTSTSSPGNWYAHCKNFLTASTIKSGRRFASEHKTMLKELEREYGVPGAILCAIIGVESRFGKLMGSIRTLDALVTLSFDYTRRAKFFQFELASFLIWCNKEHINPTAVKGSFAGAVGMCQFMPSNILKYGVDHDKDGTVKLRSSTEDALASVANYLSCQGWDATLPVTWPCRAESESAQKLHTAGIAADTTIEKAIAAGVEIETPVSASPQTPVMLVKLDVPGGCLWRLGTQNFAALLHYNRSYFYAETVRELTLAIAPSLFDN